jgi:endonuclease/exonuclease/phosphatase family metal-dependent hydrolase
LCYETQGKSRSNRIFFTRTFLAVFGSLMNEFSSQRQCEPPTNRRRWARGLIASGFTVGLVIAWGADRQPADATRPITWRNVTETRPVDAETLRVASFNIHGGKGTDRHTDLSRIAADLHDIDLAGLYEVRATPGGQYPDQAADLGARLRLQSVFLGTERRWWHDHFGNAVLATMPLAQVQRIPLAGTRGKAFRQAVLLDVPLQGETVHVLMVHIDREQDRQPQLQSVIQLFRALQSPAVLMGDLNSSPDDPALQDLLAEPEVESVIHSQLETAAPRDNIDWIIVRGLECTHAEYHSSGASDHPVVRAELQIKDATKKRR